LQYKTDVTASVENALYMCKVNYTCYVHK